jgi:hypothetical protein
VRPYYATSGEIMAAVKAVERSECRRCRTPVSDAEWKTVCILAGIAPAADPGMRTCARCVREQQEENREAARRARAEDTRRGLAPPPLGLRRIG